MKIYVDYWKVYEDGTVAMFTKTLSSYSKAVEFKNGLPDNGYNHNSKIYL